MSKRKNDTPMPDKDAFYELLTRFEECVGDALVLNTALMVLIDHERFREFNIELIRQISENLYEAKGRIKDGYGIMKC